MSEEKTTRKRRSRKAEVAEEPVAEVIDVAEITEPEISEAVSEQAEVVDDKIEEPVVIGADLAQNGDISVETPIPVAAEPVEEKPIEEKPKKNKAEKSAKKSSEEVVLTKPTWVYPTSVATKHLRALVGTFYKWRDDEVTGRICITDAPEHKGNFSKILGWINVSDIK